MPSIRPTASIENFNKLVKGLRQVVPPALLMEKLAAMGLVTGYTRESRIPLSRIKALTDELADEVEDPLLMVRAFSVLDYRPSFLCRTFLCGAHTLSDAILLLRRYMPVGTDLGQIELETARGRATLYFSPNPAFAASVQQLDSLLYAILRTLLNLGLQSLEGVNFPHSPPASLRKEYQALFPAPVRFGADRYELHFPAMELARALGWDQQDASRVARRERKLIKLNADHRWTESVEVLLTVLLRSGEGNIDRCAALLAVSRRTLQRHIEVDGATFRGLLENRRRQLAKEYLARGYSCETVALLIGYRQASQLYRSFRHWFGLSPQDYRRQLRASARTMFTTIVASQGPLAA